MERGQQKSPIGEAMAWVSRIMAIGLTMFLPSVAGSWLDARLGTSILAPLGLVAGVAVAILSLARLKKSGHHEGP
ncbi:MAG: hypothetical protein ACKOEX_03945 [Planctomycetia bacterium]